MFEIMIPLSQGNCYYLDIAVRCIVTEFIGIRQVVVDFVRRFQEEKYIIHCHASNLKLYLSINPINPFIRFCQKILTMKYLQYYQASAI